MWRANGNPTPCTDLDEIFHTHPHLSKEGFGPGLTPAPSPPGPWGLKPAEVHIFKMLSRLQINPGSTRIPQLVVNIISMLCVCICICICIKLCSIEIHNNSKISF